MGISIADELAGLNASVAALAAHHARDRDGVGETIDISLVESVFSIMESVLPEYVHAGKVTKRVGNQLTTAAPSNVYPTSDEQWIAIAVNGEGIFRRMAAAMGRPELADDPRYADNYARVANMAALDVEITRWTKTLTLTEVEGVLARAGVPAGPILSIDAIVAHPQIQAREAVRTLRDEQGIDVATYGPVPHLTERPIELASAAGAVGRDQALLSS
jgi:formyl-CoA transferase